MTHPAFRDGYLSALIHLAGMVRAGASPEAVAAYVISLGAVGGSVSRFIEDKAYPDTFAEAVFNILAD